MSDEMTLYGYNIYQNLEYRLSSKMLINIKNGRIKRLGETKARLFEYLLLHAQTQCVYDSEIIVEVFENHGLRCAKSYLSSIIGQLREAFLTVGFDRELIVRVERKSYILEQGAIQEIYSKQH